MIPAEERGSFPIYEYDREINNPFINRLRNDDKELDSMLKKGRRNISILTTAPTGCLVENSIIKTDRGNIKLSDLFMVNDVDIEKLRGLKNIWIDVKDDIFVYNVRGEKNKITKLYWNGLDETKKIIYSDGSTTESTLEHKFLVKINDKEAIWKKACDLKINDKIIKINQ